MPRPVAVSGLGSGIASQLDTASLIQKLVAARQAPLNSLKNQASAVQTQISTLGAIASALTALNSTAQDLSSGGVLGITAAYPTDAGFAARPGKGADAGSYAIQVDTLASAAKWHSAGLASSDSLRAGTFTVTADGSAYSVKVSEGSHLSDLAHALRKQGAPVSATVLDDGTRRYLSLTATRTGYDPSSVDGAPSALSVRFEPSGNGSGVDPTSQTAAKRAAYTAAVNATFSVDGLSFVRRSNSVTDAIPETTLTLQEATGVPRTLTLSNDPGSTQARLQSFVGAYNAVMQLVQAQLNVTALTDRTRSLAGDPNMRALQQSLQTVVTTPVAGLGSLHSLADLGVVTKRDGTLAIESSTLGLALGRGPNDVNAIFSDAAGGVGKLLSRLTDRYAMASTGILSMDQSNLERQVRSINDQASALQDRITAYQTHLQKQFAAMQSVVTGYANIGKYLTAVSDRAKSR